MSWRIVIRLLGAILVLGAYIAVFERPGGSPVAALNAEAPLFVFSPAHATVLSLRIGDSTAQVERRAGGWWLTAPVEGRAAPAAIAKLLETLHAARREEVITVRQRLERGLQAADFGLDAPRCVLTVGRTGAVHTVRLGLEAPLGGLVYAQVDGAPDIVATRRDLVDALPASPDALRDRALFGGDPSRAMRLEIKNAAGFIKLARHGAAWWLEQPFVALADARRVDGLLRDLYGLQAVEFTTNVVRGGVAAGLGDDAAAQVSVAESGDEAGVCAWFGRDVPGRNGLLYARLEGGQDACLVSRDAVEGVLGLKAAELRDRRPFGFSADAVMRVRLGAGEARLALEQVGTNGWRMVEPLSEAADGDRVAALLRRLGALRALNRSDADRPFAPLAAPTQGVTLAVTEAGAVGLGVASNTLAPRAETTWWIQPAADTNRLAVVRQMQSTASWTLPEREIRAALGLGAGSWNAVADPAVYRGRTLLALPARDIRRLTRWHEDVEETVVLDGGRWVAQAPPGARVAKDAVAAVTNALAGVRATRYERASPVRRAAAGLDRPRVRLTVGLAGESGIEKTLWIGAETAAGGVYVGMPGEEEWAVVPAATADVFLHSLVEW